MLRTQSQPRAAKERLLVVEDDDLVRRSITRSLAQEGYDVMAVASAEEALPHVERRRFDLCLVDIKLPNMDGLEFLERCQSQLSETGTVVLTGYGSLDETVRALEAGARGFLTKPISSQALLEAVRSALVRQQSSSEYHRRDAYQSLLKLANLTRQASNPDAVMDLFISHAMARTGASQAALFLVQGQTMTLSRCEGFLSPPDTPLLKGMGGEATLTWPGLKPLGPEPIDSICLPVVAQGKIVALALLGHSAPNQIFHQSQLEFLTLAAALMAPALSS